MRRDVYIPAGHAGMTVTTFSSPEESGNAEHDVARDTVFVVPAGQVIH